MRLLTNLSLALQFLLELAALAAFGYWGYSTGGRVAINVALAVLAPAAAATTWGLFGAPRARFHLNGISRLAFETAFFGAAALALVASGNCRWALAFAVVVAANIAFLNTRGRG